MGGWLGADRSGRLAESRSKWEGGWGPLSNCTAVGCQRYCCWVLEVLLLGVRGTAVGCQR